jgi:tungstate transport system substrate-binding protein
MESWDVHLTIGDNISGKLLLVLLEQIHDTGSINKAVDVAQISYRSGWSLLNKTEETLGKKLIQRKSGGTSGGGSALTQDGLQLLGHLKSLQRDVQGQLKSMIGEEPKADKKLMIASTTEPISTGLLDALEHAFLEETGISVYHIAAGSGQALDMAKAGRVDAVLTHAPALEDAFVQEGWGVEKIEFMKDTFVLIGPKEDPANVEGSQTIGEALKRITTAGSSFISRADRSGTHLKEIDLWQISGCDPDKHPWYVKANNLSGNEGVMMMAEHQKAYALVDLASFKISYRGLALKILWDDREGLENIFSVIPLSRTMAAVNQEDGEIFAHWLVGAQAIRIIEDFGKQSDGKSLFTPINHAKQRKGDCP